MSDIYFNDVAGEAISFPQFLRDRGLIDESWHNDACPKAVKQLPDGTVLAVWVENDDPEKREIPGSAKFTVSIYDQELSNGRELCGSNFPDVVAAVVDAVLAGAVRGLV
jgi:hypothetical protein